MTQLSIGYVPLLDAAPVIIAREMGFAAEEGLSLVLRPAPSWSAVRDMLRHGQVDAAHMLSPVPIAAALGLGGASEPFSVLSVLSANGTVVGVSNDLAGRLRTQGHGFGFDDAEAAGNALIAAADAGLRVGVPFPFSMHSELLIYWLSSLGLPAPQSLDIKTIPPSLMAAALEAGEIDAFCVGEPWGSLAVEQGVGHLLLPGSAIWSFSPEKVLATRADWAHDKRELRNQLIRAVVRAGRWLADQSSITIASEILSGAQYLNQSSELLDRGLSGQFIITPQGDQRRVPDFVEFYRGAATFPWRSQAEWIGHQLARRTGTDRHAARRKAAEVFRPDYYRDAYDGRGEDVPGASSKIEGAIPMATPVATARGQLTLARNLFFDRREFDPNAPE